MLKIKDDIDLKELKKYGFEYSSNRIFDRPCYIHQKENVAINQNKWEEKFIGSMEARELVSMSYDFNTKLFELIYDLTKNGLLEKVENNKDE